MLSMALLNMTNLFGLREVLNPTEKPTYSFSAYVRSGPSVKKNIVGIFLTNEEADRLNNLITALGKGPLEVQTRLFAQLAKQATLTLQAIWETLVRGYDAKNENPPYSQENQTPLGISYTPIATEYTDIRGNIVSKDRTITTLAELFFPVNGEVTIYNKSLAFSVYQLPVETEQQKPLIEWQHKVHSTLYDASKENV